jgi:Tfp pilus assembly protein PilN
MIEINLLPGAGHKSRSRSGNLNVLGAFAGIGDRVKDKYLMAAVVSAVVGGAAIGSMYLYQSKQADQLDLREQHAAQDSARFAHVLAVRNKAQATRDSVYQQIAVIRSIDNMRYTWPHLLEEIDLALPQYTWLTSITQTSAVTTTAGTDSAALPPKPKKSNAKADTISASKVDQQLAARRKLDQEREHADSLFNGTATSTKFRIVGQTVDIQALTLFMKNLEASPFIKNVQLTRSDLVLSDGKEVTEFQLEAENEVPPSSIIQTVPLSVAVR